MGGFADLKSPGSFLLTKSNTASLADSKAAAARPTRPSEDKFWQSSVA